MKYGNSEIHTGMQFQHGFTMLELMAVVAIAGILSVIALPNMQDFISNQRIRAAVTEMHLTMLFSRSEAIKRNDDITITRIDSDWTKGWLVETTDPTTLRTSDELSDEITLVCNTDSDVGTEACPNVVTFERTGRPDTLIEFRLYEAGNTRVAMRCVSMSLNGQPDIVLDLDNNIANGCND